MTSTVWLRWRRPRPFTDSRCLWIVPRRPFTRVTRIFLPAFFSEFFLGVMCVESSARDLFDLLAALGRDLRGPALLQQAIQGRAHDVVGIGGAMALGGDVGDTHHLEHRAHGPARLDAVAFLCRL